MPVERMLPITGGAALTGPARCALARSYFTNIICLVSTVFPAFSR